MASSPFFVDRIGTIALQLKPTATLSYKKASFDRFFFSSAKVLL